jgi:hypothetical protein
MNVTLALVLWKFVVIFFNDILIYSPSYEDHLQHLSTVLSILQRDQWHVKFSKCVFAQCSVAYMGHVVSVAGITTESSTIESLSTWPTPTNPKELRGFLGITGYYRKFIQHYAVIAQPLTALLEKGVIY